MYSPKTLTQHAHIQMAEFESEFQKFATQLEQSSKSDEGVPTTSILRIARNTNQSMTDQYIRSKAIHFRHENEKIAFVVLKAVKLNARIAKDEEIFATKQDKS